MNRGGNSQRRSPRPSPPAGRPPETAPSQQPPRRRAQPPAEKPPDFDTRDLTLVRAWAKKKSLVPGNAPAPIIKYPRMWNTKRGRYCKFKAPGAGVYGILRARPTF